MYNQAILLYNNKAGQDEISEQLGYIAGELLPLVHQFTFIQTLEQGEAEKICAEKGADTDLLLILGGDGTVHECINGLMKVDHTERPKVAILPGGTCNDFSRSLQVRTIKEAVEAIKSGESQKIDIGAANDRYFSNFIGVGLITEASQAKEGHLKEKWGKLGYIMSALQSLKDPSSFSYSIQTESESIDGEAVMVLAINGHYLGTAGLFVEDNIMNDGFIDLYILKEAGFSLLKNVYNKSRSESAKEWLSTAEDIKVIRTKSFSLKTAEPQLVDSDGELYMETPVDISVHKEAIEFLYLREQ
ncbi:diacylglycerol/lipid kinase family protein [Alkalicoccobacillus murimartini]|uniref:YegS/Rv2252/BmrU family lipid kinase n=1 Tax=Alkalicoccobacillus murimartini TaxID=171685 RepID=A0ABT9YFV4_9BACI|nr:diacylglycerol kinase family protein [Alkalicoccobacillus murimartini]MDQ0206097.1 YegS/Rv2252/BmrU family lipid kinase [Alkalicoccobacillus murimartini]